MTHFVEVVCVTISLVKADDMKPANQSTRASDMAPPEDLNDDFSVQEVPAGLTSFFQTIYGRTRVRIRIVNDRLTTQSTTSYNAASMHPHDGGVLHDSSHQFDSNHR